MKQLSIDDIKLFVKDNFSKKIKLFIFSIFVILLLFKLILYIILHLLKSGNLDKLLFSKLIKRRKE